MINRGTIKEEARRIIQGAKVPPMRVTLLVMVIVFVLERMIDGCKFPMPAKNLYI